MKFGITFKPDMTVERIVSLTRQAEAVAQRWLAVSRTRHLFGILSIA